MSKEVDNAILEERQKRKEVARKRIFWFVLLLDVALLIYIFVQILILITAK